MVDSRYQTIIFMGLINQQAFTLLAGTILYAFLRFFPTLRVRRLSDGVTSYKRARNSGMEAQTGERWRLSVQDMLGGSSWNLNSTCNEYSVFTSERIFDELLGINIISIRFSINHHHSFHWLNPRRRIVICKWPMNTAAVTGPEKLAMVKESGEQ